MLDEPERRGLAVFGRGRPRVFGSEAVVDRVTVISTNLKSVQRTARYGQRVESRLAQMCEVVPMPGVDRRMADAA